jgi:hypothetical protein
MPENRSRRAVLRAAAGATGVAGGLAGCGGRPGSLPFGGPAHLALVPDRAAGVVRVAGGAANAGAGVAPLVGPPGGRGGGTPDGGATPARLDLPVADLRARTAFATHAGDGLVGEYRGTVVDAAWSPDDVVAAHGAAHGVAYAAEGHRGRTVHVPDGESAPHVGVVAEGTYAVGSRAAVEDVLAVDAGDRSAVGDPVRRAFRGTRDAPVRYAGETPAWLEGDLSLPSGDALDLDPFLATATVAGSASGPGDDRRATTTVRADDGGAASAVESVLARYVVAVEGTGRLLAGATVERDGTDVVVRHRTTPRELLALLDGPVAPGRSALRADAMVEQDGTAVVVTWTDNRNAEQLRVRVAGCGTTTAVLDAVGESHRFETCYGDVTVVVLAHAAGREPTVVLTDVVRI